MEEKEIWIGSPSPKRDIGMYIICGLFSLIGLLVAMNGGPEIMVGAIILLVTASIAGWKWLDANNTKYRLTSERLLLEHGILSKTEDSMELYRVKDVRLYQPFVLRLLGLSNIALVSSDATSPVVSLDAVADGKSLREEIRKHVEMARQKRGVREIQIG